MPSAQVVVAVKVVAVVLKVVVVVQLVYFINRFIHKVLEQLCGRGRLGF